jgi:Tetratricopeptide repeat
VPWLVAAVGAAACVFLVLIMAALGLAQAGAWAAPLAAVAGIVAAVAAVWALPRQPSEPQPPPESQRPDRANERSPEMAELEKQPPVSARADRVIKLPERPPFLAGREDLLAELDTRLAGGDGYKPQIAALHGLAGAGKTSVALTYAHDHAAECDIMWHFAAEDPAVLAAEFGALAEALAVRARAEDPVVAVHGALAGSAARWLLIFDNAPGPEELKASVPPLGNGQVLITSRNALWPPDRAVEVPVLDVKAAADFLTARTGDTDRQAAASLAEAVGGLPLALEQAAAYVQATGNSLADYFDLFQRRRAETLAWGLPTGYGKTVTATWTLAFTQLERSEPGAVGLLRLLAFCAPEAIPLRLLMRPRPGLTAALGPAVAEVLGPLLDDELAAGNAVAALRRYSLARLAGHGAVSVHRLVQAVTADQMSEGLAAGWRQAAAAVIEATMPRDPEEPTAWPVSAALLPHTQAAFDPASDGMQKVASHLGFIGDYAAALSLQRRIVEARTALLGAEHRSTLTARAGLARWTGQAGGVAAACDQYAALVPVDEHVLGVEDLETLTVRASAANWTGQAGDAIAARDQLTTLMPVLQRVAGTENPATLAALGNLARWTGEAGDAASARDKYAELVPVRERVLGAEHPSTLDARADLANWTGQAGNAAAARDQFAELVPVRERVLGATHPRTLVSRADLSYWTGEAGNAAAARDQYTILLPIFEQVLGAEHPRSLDVRGNLAHWTGEAGNAAAARDQFATLVPARERILTAEHPRTQDARTELAYWTRQADEATQTQGGKPN